MNGNPIHFTRQNFSSGGRQIEKVKLNKLLKKVNHLTLTLKTTENQPIAGKPFMVQFPKVSAIIS